MKYFILSLMCLFSGCTYNISRSEGPGKEVIEENECNTPNNSQNLIIPVPPASERFLDFNINNIYLNSPD